MSIYQKPAINVQYCIPATLLSGFTSYKKLKVLLSFSFEMKHFQVDTYSEYQQCKIYPPYCVCMLKVLLAYKMNSRAYSLCIKHFLFATLALVFTMEVNWGSSQLDCSINNALLINHTFLA